MKKTQENKKILFFIGLALVILILIGVLVKCASSKTDSNDDKKNPGQETLVDGEGDSESEDGLDIGTDEDAEKKETENSLEFIGPDSGDTNQSENTSDNSETVDKKEDSGKDNTGNLGTETDNTGGYGEFF